MHVRVWELIRGRWLLARTCGGGGGGGCQGAWRKQKTRVVCDAPGASCTSRRSAETMSWPWGTPLAAVSRADPSEHRACEPTGGRLVRVASDRRAVRTIFGC